MIEYRASLWKRKKFEGGFSLEAGTPIYVRETEHGWIGHYYTDKGSCHSFALEGDEFSIWSSADCDVEYLVVIPDPPTPPEKIEADKALARRRLEHQIKRHREAADELEKVLGTV